MKIHFIFQCVSLYESRPTSTALPLDIFTIGSYKVFPWFHFLCGLVLSLGHLRCHISSNFTAINNFFVLAKYFNQKEACSLTIFQLIYKITTGI